MRTLPLSLLVLLLLQAASPAETVRVSNPGTLGKALTGAKPGMRIEVAAGEYPTGLYLKGVQGTKEQPIVLTGADPAHPPVFHGSIQFSSPAWLEIQDLRFAGITKNNGLHIDDSGNPATPAHHITIRRVQVADIGPVGNFDGMKLSGLEDYLITECRIEHWGSGEGSGIDHVGCRRGVIEKCVLVDREDAKSAGHDGIQMKGGSRDIVIRGNRFEHAGMRGINIGGNTGLKFFRPPLDQLPAGETPYEAKLITVENNVFIGTQAPICLATADGAVIRHNTFYQPGRYALRILQETKDPQFVKCRGGVFTDNLFVFRTAGFVDACNIGPGAAPETFKFERNWWFCQDNPARSKPKLPATETEGVYSQDPKLDQDLRPAAGSPAAAFGAQTK